MLNTCTENRVKCLHMNDRNSESAHMTLYEAAETTDTRVDVTIAFDASGRYPFYYALLVLISYSYLQLPISEMHICHRQDLHIRIPLSSVAGDLTTMTDALSLDAIMTGDWILNTSLTGDLTLNATVAGDLTRAYIMNT
jgi:hypothetical protein